MTSFVFDIGAKARAAARFIDDVRSELQAALVTEKRERKITQQAIAQAIGTSRSVINRQLMGQENLTLRTVAELAWALGWEPEFKLRKPQATKGENIDLRIGPTKFYRIEGNAESVVSYDAISPAQTESTGASVFTQMRFRA